MRAYDGGELFNVDIAADILSSLQKDWALQRGLQNERRELTLLSIMITH